MGSSESSDNTPRSRNGSMKSKFSHAPVTETENAQQSPSTIVQGTVHFSQSNKPARRGRQGPLTEEQRTEAAAVRKAGACKSCREKKIKASACYHAFPQQLTTSSQLNTSLPSGNDDEGVIMPASTPVSSRQNKPWDKHTGRETTQPRRQRRQMLEACRIVRRIDQQDMTLSQVTKPEYSSTLAFANICYDTSVQMSETTSLRAPPIVSESQDYLTPTPQAADPWDIAPTSALPQEVLTFDQTDYPLFCPSLSTALLPSGSNSYTTNSLSEDQSHCLNQEQYNSRGNSSLLRNSISQQTQTSLSLISPSFKSSISQTFSSSLAPTTVISSRNQSLSTPNDDLPILMRNAPSSSQKGISLSQPSSSSSEEWIAWINLGTE
ncbi:hypothetical protein OIDMADRAFT_34620 [Oidiodendron maius Zn]|uniref:Uncharacterized protein n=1 Tax=Oidiodendron maius (strain Zn) TaxID=913774 RepID=A0A0C3GTK4_OIDMZ|nr:hypothetical protein OIDMADRAFT_34620 [Oidiodendron maius Zn]